MIPIIAASISVLLPLVWWTTQGGMPLWFSRVLSGNLIAGWLLLICLCQHTPATDMQRQSADLIRDSQRIIERLERAEWRIASKKNPTMLQP